MKKKIKYILNKYANRDARVTLKNKGYSLVRKLLIGFILASIVNFVFSYFFHTPKVYELTNKNNELLIKYKLLHDKIDNSLLLLHDIRNRDNGIYRTLFAIDTIPIKNIMLSENRYRDAKGNRYYGQIEDTWRLLDSLTNITYIQTFSLDTLQFLAKDKEKMADAVPSICPMDKDLITGHIGKFGGRIHPILKYYTKHTGIDMPGKKGTPIYATADGIVVSNGYESGYGLAVTINHGYGYKTKYAHLSKATAIQGNSVKRGEKIGELGSTGSLSTGPHLHYEVIYRNNFMNSINYFSDNMSKEDYEKIVNSAKETTYETN